MTMVVLLLFLSVPLLIVAGPASSKTDEDLDSHPTWAILDKQECGESAADRIIGGTQASLGQFPWIARLGYKSEYETTLHFWCGGALVSPRFVVTAAHCMESREDGIKLASVRLGEHDVGADPDCRLKVCAPRVQDVPVAREILHERYNKPYLHNDLGLIELKHAATMHDYVSPICLPRAPQRELNLVGEMATVAGWGKMNMTTEESATNLQRVQLPILPPKTCNTFGSSFNVTDGEICAGGEVNKDACGGDSGGPLMKVFDTDEGPKMFLIGVVSFGPSNCGIKKPGVYTSISYFDKWLLDRIKE